MNHPFLQGGGQVAHIIAAHDWSNTPLGPIDSWPQSLKTTVALILRSPVPIVTLWGEQGVMIYNDGYSLFAAGRHPASLGANVREAWPEVADFNDHVIKVGLAGGTLAYQDQELTLHRSGKPEQVWMNLDYSPIVDEAGQPVGVMVVVVETTATVAAERRLREESEQARAAEKSFRTLAQSMPIQVWTSNADGVVEWFNDQVYRYTGSEAPLDRERWRQMVHAEDRDAATEQWYAAIGAGKTFEAEFRIRRADGAWRWHLVRALPIMDEQGVVQRWVGTNTDIQDQKSTAAMLRQQVAERTAERDRMWQYSTDVMLVAELEGWITAINPAFTRLLGWEAAEVVGTSIYSLIHPDDLEASAAEMAALAGGATTFRFENRTLRKGGGYAILSWTAAPDARYVHAVGRDMTAERAAAEEMRRTALALQQSQKMEAIGKLTGGVAHDFNNLLQVISGNLQLLAGDVAGNARAERRLDSALAGVSKGARLASYLLAFGRRQALDPRVVKIGRFIAGMEDMLRRSLGEEVEVEMVISGGLWNTLVDTTQVENAVLNLCINARDAMDGVGKLTIEVGNAHLDDAYVAAHHEVSAGQYVVIAVSDTGSGMTPEVLEQAFDPFFSTKPEGKGSGLGLSMVYGFARQSGGHVKIYSEEGSGTTVKLYLPRSMEAEDTPLPLETRAVIGGTETILVAEDDEGVRATVVELLSELGYQVLKASDAASALSIIDSGIHIDLLFTDVVMPGPLRSPDLARKARERRPGIAVLFTSGYTENAIVHGGRLDAGVDLLGKPYTREALARKVRHVLANRQHAKQLRAETPPPAPALDGASRILLVEDEPELRDTTAELLQLLGHTVLQAGDAGGALALLAQHQVDILLTDISLPDLSGEVLAARARESHPALRVIYASGQHPRAPLERAQVLLKPYSLDKLMQALQYKS
ncbi:MULTISPECIES: PAS domain-containing protein [unclassified Duganella]|uniref:hybrid sensor histidine kinase/response regulator n=1 Tax=unclassified Duganella TaxID=2636909 RepID=UPI00088FADF4|nr:MULTISPECIES: PAS domain-containing protein [unclassified Duganella]SDF60137.1 PAS domain S-box-containing protein [Duganella sp. OV458]SDI68592.1 PAS domain S-box-containing protein [Duganella sp. OV510]